MGNPQRRKGRTAKNKAKHKVLKTKHFQKHLDQIHEDLKPENQSRLLNQPIDEDLPGLGQFYCIECSRYFTSQPDLERHRKSKPHKKQLRLLRDKPYTHEDAERFAGMTRPVRDTVMR